MEDTMFDNPNPINPQYQDPNVYKWMQAMHEEQKKQTSLLSNIRSVAYFFFVLAFISMLGGCCIAIGGASTLSHLAGQ
jgi:hypothetical protein